MDRLQQFYLDEGTREDVKEFLHLMLKEEAVSRVFTGKDVVGLLEAGVLIDKTFSKLEELYKKKKEVLPEETE